MGASLSVKLTQTGKNETSRTGTVSVVVTITSDKGTHNHFGSSNLGQGSLLYVTVDGNTYSSYVTFGSEDTGTVTSTVYSNSFTVSYTSAGTKTVSVSARCVTATSAGTISGSDSLALIPIPASGGSSGDDGGSDDGGDAGGDSGGTGYSYEHTLNFIIGSHCFILYVKEGTGKKVSASQSVTYTSNAPTNYVFYFMTDDGYKLSECSIDGVAVPEHGMVTFTATKGKHTIIAAAVPDEADFVRPKGVLYIDNGVGHDVYQCYIDNGTGWDPLGFIRIPGTVTTNADETAVSVDCGFAPDLVVLHLSETYNEYHCSCAASFDVHDGDVNTAFWSENLQKWVDLYIHREDQGFSVTAYVSDEPAELTFDYVAIKYT